MPFLLPPVDDEYVAEQLNGIDGLIFSGGKDYHPRHYNQEPHTSFAPVHDRRERYDLLLFTHARQLGLPSLGICGGMQLAAIHFGASIIQDLPSQRPGDIEHKIETRSIETLVHQIHVAPDSQLAELVGEASFGGNSSHHQAVDEQGLPEGLIICARASDGVAEAIELTPYGPLDNGAWFLAVQWHPEWLCELSSHQRLFSALVEAGGKRRATVAST